jgi:hypothetical protein
MLSNVHTCGLVTSLLGKRGSRYKKKLLSRQITKTTLLVILIHHDWIYSAQHLRQTPLTRNRCIIPNFIIPNDHFS